MWEQIAAREGYIELVQLLLGAVSVGKGDQGAMKGKDELKWADVDASNRAHQTPLMLALSPSVRLNNLMSLAHCLVGVFFLLYLSTV